MKWGVQPETAGTSWTDCCANCCAQILPNVWIWLHFLHICWFDRTNYDGLKQRKGSITTLATVYPALCSGGLTFPIVFFLCFFPPRFSQNGPVWWRCPRVIGTGGRGIGAQQEPRWSSGVHRWNLTSLQANQSSASPHHGPVQPHSRKAKLLHRKQVALHLWRGQRCT